MQPEPAVAVMKEESDVGRRDAIERVQLGGIQSGL